MLNISREKIIGSTIVDLIPGYFSQICHESDREILSMGVNKVNTLKLSSSRKKINVYRVALKESSGITEGIFGYIINDHKSPQFFSEIKSNLTAREMEILTLMANGKSAKLIAKILDISHHTVVHHIKKIYIKLDVNSKINALIEARSLGILGR
jgi:DNA-binding CsgD family transcriptional regulator